MTIYLFCEFRKLHFFRAALSNSRCVLKCVAAGCINHSARRSRSAEPRSSRALSAAAQPPRAVSAPHPHIPQPPEPGHGCFVTHSSPLASQLPTLRAPFFPPSYTVRQVHYIYSIIMIQMLFPQDTAAWAVEESLVWWCGWSLGVFNHCLPSHSFSPSATFELQNCLN